MRAWKAELREIRRLNKILAGIKDRPGKKRKARKNEKVLRQAVNRARARARMFDGLDEAQLGTSLAAIKTRLDTQIAQLELEIRTGSRVVKGKTVAPTDAEVDAKTALRDDLKAQRDEIFGKKELTDEQRIEIAIKAAERRIAERERRKNEGDLFPKKKTLVAKPTFV